MFGAPLPLRSIPLSSVICYSHSIACLYLSYTLECILNCSFLSLWHSDEQPFQSISRGLIETISLFVFSLVSHFIISLSLLQISVWLMLTNRFPDLISYSRITVWTRVITIASSLFISPPFLSSSAGVVFALGSLTVVYWMHFILSHSLRYPWARSPRPSSWKSYSVCWREHMLRGGSSQYRTAHAPPLYRQETLASLLPRTPSECQDRTLLC